MFEKNLAKFILTAISIFGLLIYHFTGYLLPKDPDFFMVCKIGQGVAFIFCFLFALNNQWPAKLVHWNNFIGGKYNGTSESCNEDSNINDKTIAESDLIENFKIRQSLFETRISGISTSKKGGKLVSSWTGILFKQTGEKYYFGIELTTTNTECGILEVFIDDKKFNGFYFSGDINSRFVWRITAERVN